MRLTRRRVRGLITFALCGLLFELVAFSDFDGAWADDLKLLEYGASTGVGTPPVNMVFLLDSSGSMNNLICEELTGSLECDTGSLTAKAAPNSSTVCESSALEALTGPDVTGDGVPDPYQGAFASDGTTWNASLYPAFDTRGTYADVFVSWTTLDHGLHSPYGVRATGSGSTDQEKIEGVIDTDCGSITDCQERQRCIYSLRTQGYFWEPWWAPCGSGDPLGVCGTTCDNGGSCGSGENPCNCPEDCDTTSCDGPSAGSPSFLGDFFNFYPPKSYALVKAFTDTVGNLNGDARIAVSDFGDVGSGGVSYDFDPTCTDTTAKTSCFDGKGSTSCFDPNDASLEAYLYNTLAFNNSTPLARALDNAGAYFTTTTVAPICDYSSVTTCAEPNNAVILISDGFPSSDASSATQLPHSNNDITGFSNSYAYDNHEWVDDVAKRLAEIDHRSDLSGEQTVSTYTVSFGLINAIDPTTCVGLMQQTAVAGGGTCLPATSVDELRDALTNIVLSITTRVQGFTAPALATTRASSKAGLATAAFFPKASYSVWEGHVYGFEVCDETLPGAACECGDAGNPDELCVLDASGSTPATDASDGYLDASSPPFWDAAICLAKDPADPPPESAGTLAPDRGDLDTSSCYKSASARTIYTAVDHDSDGVLEQIPFTEASIDAYTVFRDAVKSGDTAGAKKIVSFYRGVDTFDADGDSNVTEDRNLATIRDGSGDLVDGWWKLGDIFHSIPNTVERPTGRSIGSWSSAESYQAFKADWSDRDRVMLVGANDGMLHAFKTGTWDAANEKYDVDATAGSELWAYVTPEMLPGLGNVCDAPSGGCSLSSHVPMVDGSVMVRDVWIGGTADETDPAQKSKWKTVAVVGHRRGGRTFVALDVTDISSPQLLWRFPEPGSSEEALVGQSWLDVFPAPASIGPLQVEDSGGNAYDKWVVLLSGGFDAAASRGNALFVLDAWTGNVLWQTTDTGAGDDTDAMDYSFPATPVFYANIRDSIHPYIDGIVAADTGGQIWHVTPAAQVLDDTAPDFNVEIVFRSVASLVAPDARGGNNDGTVDFAEYQPRPFFFAPTLTRVAGQVRAVLGTGDRDMLVPHGSVPPSGDVLGAACTVDGDCASGTCVSGYCSECSSDGDCTSPETCVDTDCGYHYCSSSDCSVPVGGNDVSMAINDAICTYEQRVYAVNLATCANGMGGRRPCVESDLVEIVDGTTYASQTDAGWYYVLDEGEKVTAPYDVFGGFALYSTFVPTVACGSGSVPVCTPSAKGVGRMHIRNVVTGKTIDWNGNDAYDAGEEFVDLGTGVPAAPSLTVAVGSGHATPTLLTPGSGGVPAATSMDGLQADLVMEILRFPVSKDLHARLHE